jgi:predicted phage tail protein
MITIILRGKLGRKFGREWKLDARSPAEALKAIDTLKGGLLDYILELESEMQGYHLQVNERGFGADMLAFGFIGDTVTITPLLKGADTKGVLEIVAGVVLIAAAIAAPYLLPAGAVAVGTIGGLAVGLVASLGLALALGGVARLLQHSPSAASTAAAKGTASYIFSGPVNTVAQGEPVPVAYGAPIVGSAVIAASIRSYDIGSGNLGGGGHNDTDHGGTGHPPL